MQYGEKQLHASTAAAESGENTGIACDLSVFDKEQLATHSANAESLLTSASGIRETPGGYAFCLAPDAGTLRQAAEFMANEGRCCPFFRFELTLSEKREAAWLEISGTPAVKDYMRAAMLPRLQEARPGLVPDAGERNGPSQAGP